MAHAPLTHAAQLLAAAATGDPTLDWLSRAGALGILAFVVVAFIRGWIVPGAAHLRVIDERNRAMDIIYEQAQATRRAIQALEATPPR